MDIVDTDKCTKRSAGMIYRHIVLHCFHVVALNINKLMIRQCTQLSFFVLLVYYVYNHMLKHIRCIKYIKCMYVF
jgi:hypothetical protein